MPPIGLEARQTVNRSSIGWLERQRELCPAFTADRPVLHGRTSLHLDSCLQLGDPCAGLGLDLGQCLLLAVGYERDGRPLGLHPRCPSYPVEVNQGLPRNVVVDDVGDSTDI